MLQNNPVLNALKARSLGMTLGADDAASVSSHGSARASTTICEPNFYPTSGISKSYRPNNRSAFSKPPYPLPFRREKSRQTVEDWLWDPRTPVKVENTDETLYTDFEMDGHNKPIFDLSRKDFALAQTFPPRPSTPFPSLWNNEDSFSKDPEVTVIENQKLSRSPQTTATSKEIPIKGGNSSNFRQEPVLEEVSPAFRTFLDQFKAAQSMTDKMDTMIKSPMDHDDTPYSASYPYEYYWPDIRNITCDISTKSTRRFWLEKLVAYHKLLGERAEEEIAKRNFESDLLGTNKNRGDDTFEDDINILTEDRAFDRAFLTTICDENEENETDDRKKERAFGEIGIEEIETDSNDSNGKSSGYIGSCADEEVRRDSDSDSNVRNKENLSEEPEAVATIITTTHNSTTTRKIRSKEELDLSLLISTSAAKFYRQNAGRRRRCTSTPLASPEKSFTYEALMASIMLPPKQVPPKDRVL